VSALLTCEVVNLNRNVKITGSSGAGAAGFGAHVMLLAPTNGESAIHHVEFTRVGQQFRVGRYPIHLHAVTNDGGVGDVSRTTIVGVSVHHSFNRGINIHGGRGATVNASTICTPLPHQTQRFRAHALIERLVTRFNAALPRAQIRTLDMRSSWRTALRRATSLWATSAR
jgi:hypothetical protein